MKKYKIQKDSVQETLIIPLYGRKQAMDMYPDLFDDTDCQILLDNIEYGFKKTNMIKSKIGAIMAAIRKYDMVSVCNEYLKDHPKACVVNLGCGLDSVFCQVDNGTAKGYNLDFYDVIEMRNELLPLKNREINLAVDLMDFSWFKKINYRLEDGIVFIASGVFYYFKQEDVKRLLSAMADYFKGGKIAFDATNYIGLKSMAKTWLEPSKMKNINVYFSIEDKEEIKNWNFGFLDVSCKGYLTGYRSLDKRFGFFTNLLFKYLDNSKRCQIIEITFKGE